MKWMSKISEMGLRAGGLNTKGIEKVDKGMPKVNPETLKKLWKEKKYK